MEIKTSCRREFRGKPASNFATPACATSFDQSKCPVEPQQFAAATASETRLPMARQQEILVISNCPA